MEPTEGNTTAAPEPPPAAGMQLSAQAPSMQPAQADSTGRPSRVSIEHLLQMPDNVKREAWISALVDAEVARQTFAQDRALAREFALSGQFDDLKAATADQAIATAMVKINLGRNWGLNAADSMRYLYFANGRPAIENEIIAAKLQQAGYEWDIEWLEDEVDHKGRKHRKCVGCVLWIKKWSASQQRYNPILDRSGKAISVSFTQFDADTAMIWEKGKQIPLSEKWNFKSWGRDMYYWRTVGRVKKFHAPHVLRGAVSREEALEMIPMESMPPAMLPADLQGAIDAPPTEDSAPPRGRSVRDKILAQESFLQAEPESPAPGPPTQTTGK
jgi:hypothetical protein